MDIVCTGPMRGRRHVRLRPARAEGRAKGGPVAGKRGGWILVDGWDGWDGGLVDLVDLVAMRV